MDDIKTVDYNKKDQTKDQQSQDKKFPGKGLFIIMGMGLIIIVVAVYFIVGKQPAEDNSAIPESQARQSETSPTTSSVIGAITKIEKDKITIKTEPQQGIDEVKILSIKIDSNTSYKKMPEPKTNEAVSSQDYSISQLKIGDEILIETKGDKASLVLVLEER